MSAIQILAFSNSFSASHRKGARETNVWFYKEAKELSDEITPFLQRGIPIEIKYIYRAEQFLDLAFANIFPMKSRDEIEHILGIAPQGEDITK